MSQETGGIIENFLFRSVPEIFLYTSQELLQKGFQKADGLSSDQRALVDRLHRTLEGIKEFCWNRFRLVGIDSRGKIPPFFVHFEDNNAYYHPQTIQTTEHFIFNDTYVDCPE